MYTVKRFAAFKSYKVSYRAVFTIIINLSMEPLAKLSANKKLQILDGRQAKD